MISKKIMALAVAIGLAPPAMAETDVTLMYTATAPFVAAFVAKDQGFFEKNGVNVTMQLGQNGSVVLAGVVSGSAQVGIPTPTVVFQAVENGLDLRMFAATNIFPDDTISGLVAGVDSGIEKASDLNGRKIGVPGIGGLLDVVMRKWVDENGGDSSKINIVEVILPQTADVIRSGQVDGVASVDPFASRAIDSGVAKLVGKYTDVITPGSTAGVFVTTADWAKENADAVTAMQVALDEAAAFIGAHPDEARAAIAHYTTLPPPVVAGIALPNLETLHLEPKRSFAFWEELALQQGLISKPLDLDTLVIEFKEK